MITLNKDDQLKSKQTSKVWWKLRGLPLISTSRIWDELDICDEFLWRIFVTYNLLTIASFRIGVPSILLLIIIWLSKILDLYLLFNFKKKLSEWTLVITWHLLCFSQFVLTRLFHSPTTTKWHWFLSSIFWVATFETLVILILVPSKNIWPNCVIRVW